MNSDLKLPFFDPDYCLKAVRWSSAVCVAWLLTELKLLAVLNPRSGRCSDWVIFRGKPSETHVGFLVILFTALPTAWICFISVRWRRFSEKMFNAILEHADLVMDHNKVWLVVCIGWALFCSIPLWMMLSNCTGVFMLLGF
jgi:hypothetical protein